MTTENTALDEAIARGDIVKDDEGTATTTTAAPTTPSKEEEGAKNKNDNPFIPRDRFNEAVGKERDKREAAELRAAELEARLANQVVTDDIVEAQKQLKDLAKQRNQLLSDGKLDEATDLDEKISQIQDAIAERKADIKAFQAKEAAKSEFEYDQVVAQLEMDHPEVDPDSEDYDEEKVVEIRSLMRGYQQEMRLSPAKALKRAISRVFPAAAKATSLRAEDTTGRKAEAVERNVDAARRQPASSKEAGKDHDKAGGGLDAHAVMNMSYEEFSKLGEDVLARLRGDTL